MIWSTMVDKIKNIAVEIFTQEAEESLLLSQNILLLAVLIAVGVLWCFLGLKWIRLWSALIGMAAGLLGGIFAADMLGMDALVSLVAGAVCGMLLLVLCARFYRFGVFVCIGSIGAVSTAFFLHLQGWILPVICAAVGLVLALISIKFTTIMGILVTAFFGAITAESAIAFLLPIQGTVLEIVIGVFLGAIGVLVQLLLESKKRKKQSLKKAAEIRNTHSTENEVEKARAMMENLDQISKEDENAIE